MDEMRDRIVAQAKRHRTKCVEFLRELIATPSESQQEEAIALRVRKEMLDDVARRLVVLDEEQQEQREQ